MGFHYFGADLDANDRGQCSPVSIISGADQIRFRLGPAYICSSTIILFKKFFPSGTTIPTLNPRRFPTDLLGQLLLHHLVLQLPTILPRVPPPF